MLNQQIQNYKILSPLGEGGMAFVYLAHDNKFDTQVAVKVLNKEYVHNENIRKRFLAEARNMYRMSHPNIVKVTDLIDDGNTVAFVMEYIEGETLKEYLERKGKLKDEEIKSIFTQMLDAVGYVHKQNLVHRDIKPSNFMLDTEGKIKLMDFGIAKNTDVNSAEYTQTGTGMQMGTPMYMSPEQIRATHSVTNQSDIYSLGVVLWQMVAGRKPYDLNELSVPEIQVSILKEALVMTGKHNWDSIIKKATEKEMDKRFLGCNLFIEALNNSHNTGDTIKYDDGLFDLDDFEDDDFFEDDDNNSEKTVVETNRPAFKTDDLGIEFIWVGGGTFTMGSPRSDADRFDDEHEHRVSLDGYYMSKYPITQAQWQKVMGHNPSHYQGNGSDCPVENVSWDDCQVFINKINEVLGTKYRLPTEAEWEFAAKGGIKSKGFKYAGSNDIKEVAWFEGNRCIEVEKRTLWGLSKNKETQYLGTHPVGKKKGNELGLHDMSGNVWEWCADWYNDYPGSPQKNSQGPLTGSRRVYRGGGWGSSAQCCRSARRSSLTPDNRHLNLGFRLVSPE